MRRTKLRIVIVGGALLVLAAWAGMRSVVAQSGKAAATIWPAADLKWVDNPGLAGAKIVVLWGDPKTGAYGALKRIPGGTSLAEHTHTADQRVIAVSGTIVLTPEGGAARELGAGSYAFVPGGLKHTAMCKTGPECVYFEEQPGAADLKYTAGKTGAPKH